MKNRLQNFFNSFTAFYDHIHSKNINSNILNFRATFYAGILLVISFLVLIVSGIFLMYYYVPTANGAWDSMQIIEWQIRSGSLMRSLHYIAAQLMVVSLFIHLLSLLLRRAYNKKRAVNWTIGLLLFIVTIILSYTGYLLPYDQLAYWAITVGANMADSAPIIGSTIKQFMLGGNTIESTTILRFYVHHCVTLPLIISALLMLHFYRIRKDGGLKINSSSTRKITREKMFGFEIIIFLIVILASTLFALYLDLPLGYKANPEITPNPMKAPWYLIGLQELLHFYHPFFVTYIVPSAFFLFLFAIPSLPESYQNLELKNMSFKTRLLVNAFFIFAIISSVFIAYHIDITIIIISLFFTMLLFLSAKNRLLSGKFANNSLIFFFVSYLLIIYLAMTIIAYFFRGANWEIVL